MRLPLLACLLLLLVFCVKPSRQFNCLSSLSLSRPLFSSHRSLLSSSVAPSAPLYHRRPYSRLLSVIAPPDDPSSPPISPLSTSAPSSVFLENEVRSSFLSYAMSIILGRALPDVRDGQKPVHRRLLYAMHGLSLLPSSPTRKSARLVGEVLGKFHPHGDLSVYDALVRMVQPFSTNEPLAEGQGNFGSVDDDPAAAMRYTEVRMTQLAAEAVLANVDDSGVVPFSPNFDGNEVEPQVLPARLPLLLINGGSGIAVGMATNVPPHNLVEVANACVALLDSRMSTSSSPAVTDEQLQELLPGPDFPTGGRIMGTAGAKKLYLEGNGGVLVRATTHFETVRTSSEPSSSSSDTPPAPTTSTTPSTTTASKTRKKKSKREGGDEVTISKEAPTGTEKGRVRIIVTELPFQVNKALLLTKLAALVNDREIEGISDLRDESDRDGMRVVVELKRDANPSVVLNNLYKKTAMQSSFAGNMLALFTKGGVSVPRRFTLREALNEFLDFRFETVRRKAAFDLRRAASRRHVVEGMVAALADVNLIVEVVKSSKDSATAREIIMRPRGEGGIGLTQQQAEAVLKLQLGQITRLNKGKLEEELSELTPEVAALEKLMNDDDTVRTAMVKEINYLSTKYGRPRKTVIEADESDISDVDLILNNRSVIVVTKGGYIKRMPLNNFVAQRRGTRGKVGVSSNGVSSHGDSSNHSDDNESSVLHCFACNDHDPLLFISERGVAYGIRAYQVPVFGRTARGMPIPSVLPMGGEGDEIASVLPLGEFSSDATSTTESGETAGAGAAKASDWDVVLATEKGIIKRTPLAAFKNLTSRGLKITTLDKGDKLRWVHPCKSDDDVVLGTANGMATRFPSSDVRATGRGSRGVRAMKLRAGDSIVDMVVLPSGGEEGFILAVTEKGYGKRLAFEDLRTQARGGLGCTAMKFKPGEEGNDRLACFTTVHANDEVLLVTSNGVIVRQRVSEIPVQSRTATGVRVQRLGGKGGGDEIKRVCKIQNSGEAEEEDVVEEEEVGAPPTATAS